MGRTSDLFDGAMQKFATFASGFARWLLAALQGVCALKKKLGLYMVFSYRLIESIACILWFVPTKIPYDKEEVQEDCVGTLAALFAAVVSQGLGLVISEQEQNVRPESIWIYFTISFFTLLTIRHIVSITKTTTAQVDQNENNQLNYWPLWVWERTKRERNQLAESQVYYFGKGSVMIGKFFLLGGTIIVVSFVLLALDNRLPGQAKEYVGSSKYIFQSIDESDSSKVGAAIVFRTQVEKEVAESKADLCLQISWDHDLGKQWRFSDATIQVFTPEEYEQSISGKLVAPKAVICQNVKWPTIANRKMFSTS